MLTWRGEALKQKTELACKLGINTIMRDCVLSAKNHHPGWNNVTGTAEGSVRIQEAAHRVPRGIGGEWGSVNVDYVLKLELKHGHFLMNAATKNYPLLNKTIKAYLL